MENIKIIPVKNVNGAEFGCDRSIVREIFGNNFKEMKKTIFSENTMDVYDSYHIFFSEDNCFEAIEIFGNVCVTYDGETLFPNDIKHLRDIFPNLIQDEEGFIDYENSIAVTISPDDDSKLGSILIACKGYYS